MQKIFTWIQANKLSVVLLVIIGYFVYQNNWRYLPMGAGMGPFTSKSSSGSYEQAYDVVGGAPMAIESMGMAQSRSIAPYEPEIAPSASSDRLVIRDTSLSLQVKDVSKSMTDIEQIVETAGGFLVNSNVAVPEEAATGSISVRVPEESRAEVLTNLRSLAVKVVSEHVSGRDVTDQYEDISAQLDTYVKTQQKFEAILDQAEEVQDILTVQRELVNLQRQIDSLKGRQQYLEQSSRLTLITVYLSTDEFALPFVPNESWRPNVIFKQAVRSLVRSFRSFADLAIWLVVYSPVWLLVLVIFRWWKRRISRV